MLICKFSFNMNIQQLFLAAILMIGQLHTADVSNTQQFVECIGLHNLLLTN